MSNQSFPDVKAYKLDLAMELLDRCRIFYHIKETVSVKSIGNYKFTPEQNPQLYRVIAQRERGGGFMELIVAREANVF